MKADGTLLLNQESVEFESLDARIKEILPRVEEKTLIIKADKTVQHGVVVEVMDMAKLNGLEKLIIATKEKTESKDLSP